MTDLSDYLDTINQGDAARLPLPDACIDLTVTSPPYGELRDYDGFTFDFEAIARELWRVTKPGGVVVWVVDDEVTDGDCSLESFKQALFFKELGFKIYERIIYEKGGIRFPRANGYFDVWEMMFVLSKGFPKTVNLLRDRRNNPEWFDSNSKKRYNYKRGKDGSFSARKAYQPQSFGVRFNVWRYSPGGGKTTADSFSVEHPAQFPEALARDHILSWSNADDVVLDPMCGSGTVPKMCVELGRHFVGFDCSLKYVGLSRRRVAGARRPLFVANPE